MSGVENEGLLGRLRRCFGFDLHAEKGGVVEIDDFLRMLVEQRGSDLHVKTGSSACVRVNGHLLPLSDRTLTPEEVEHWAFYIMPKKLSEEFRQSNEADFAYSISGIGRFRVNAFRQRGTVGMVFRRVQSAIPDITALGLPPIVGNLADERRGLVLVTGPTGSGKTTTLASMIDRINQTRRCHIVTIEDPIEVIHTDKLALVSQREIGMDTKDFATAMKRVLRQDPDVILVGEMRDPETVWAALAASETGHFVLSTLHTTDAQESVNRLIDFFPSAQQKQVRLSLAGALRGVVSQRLAPLSDGQGRTPIVEVMVTTGRIFDAIVDPEKTNSLHELIKEGEYYGMQTFDQAVYDLFVNGRITIQDALSSCSHPHDLKIMLQQSGVMRNAEGTAVSL